LLIYAFIALDTPLLGFLAFRGFYIRLDEEKLYKKVNDKSMKKDLENDMDKMEEIFSNEMLDLDPQDRKSQKSKDS
jgi:predicted RNA-binding protein YlxR (DUF448 family)